MKRIILPIIFCIGLSTGACEKSAADLCGGERPERTLTWLKDKIDGLSSATECNSISRTTYKNQTVFVIANCDANVNSIPALFNCEGKHLTLTSEEYENLNFTGPIELIWKSN